MATVNIDNHRAMKCAHPLILEGKPAPVGCGQCTPCRINKQRTWTGRMLMESSQHPFHRQAFVTLTVDDEHQVKTNKHELTLSRAVPTAFRKRLRHVYPDYRYFLVGEYGDRTRRPHYHAIMFGAPLRADVVRKAWGQGHISLGFVSQHSIAYCAHYTTKRLTGDYADNHYGSRLPEFSQMSRRPALGDSFIVKLARWYKTEPGQRALRIDRDVTNTVRLNGVLYPLGDRHRRLLRRMSGLPELKMELRQQDPEHWAAVEAIRWEEFDRVTPKQREESAHALKTRKAIYRRATF